MTMRHVFLILIVLAGLSACTEYEDFELRPVSFEIDGKTYYSAKDIRTAYGGAPEAVVMEIRQYGDSLDITYHRQGDFINYGLEELSFNIKGVVGTFAKGSRIEFSYDMLPETAWQWYQLPYIIFSPIKTTSAAESDSYCATEGWIKFTEINLGKRTVAGQFEFKAVLVDEQECDHLKEIEVKNGSFKNIPFNINNVQETGL